MKKNKSFTIINGPNLNLLGARETEVYGSMTLSEIQHNTENRLKDFKLDIEWFQSNIEGEIVDKIQLAAKSNRDVLIINPAAYSHTSVAILDALKVFQGIKIEVHLSNTNAREEFRHVKLTAKASNIVMEGLGADAYFLAIYSQLINEDM